MAKKDEPAAPLEPGARGVEREGSVDLPPRDFGGAVRELLARRRPAAERHPPPAELRDYRGRRLPVRMAEELREHLSLCRRCCRLLLSLPPFGRRRRRE